MDVFKSEASRILFIAKSAYSTAGFFDFDEWQECKRLVKERADLKKRNETNVYKTAVSYGVT